MEWGKLLYVIGAALLIWLLYRQIKGNPEMFSRTNLSKSFFTLGILALLLIGFIGLLVVMLRS
jgi:hypothetical protein